jgi:hypothetical protein
LIQKRLNSNLADYAKIKFFQNMITYQVKIQPDSELGYIADGKIEMI